MASALDWSIRRIQLTPYTYDLQVCSQVRSALGSACFEMPPLRSPFTACLKGLQKSTMHAMEEAQWIQLHWEHGIPGKGSLQRDESIGTNSSSLSWPMWQGAPHAILTKSKEGTDSSGLLLANCAPRCGKVVFLSSASQARVKQP